MTPKELAEKTIRDIQKRRYEKEKGIREARDHYYENFAKINNRIRRMKKR